MKNEEEDTGPKQVTDLRGVVETMGYSHGRLTGGDGPKKKKMKKQELKNRGQLTRLARRGPLESQRGIKKSQRVNRG